MLLLLWSTAGVEEEKARFGAGVNAGAAGAGADEVNVEKKSSSKPFKIKNKINKISARSGKWKKVNKTKTHP